MATTLTPARESIIGLPSLAYFRKHAWIPVIAGILQIAVGVYALLHFVAFSLASTLVLGTLFLVGAVFHAVYAITEHTWQHAAVDVLMAVLFTIAGAFTLVNPVVALATVTLLVGSLFLLSGIMRIIASFVLRPVHMGWMMLGGVLATVLGMAILMNWPTSSFWALGLLVGVDFLTSGIAMAMFGFNARIYEESQSKVRMQPEPL